MTPDEIAERLKLLSDQDLNAYEKMSDTYGDGMNGFPDMAAVKLEKAHRWLRSNTHLSNDPPQEKESKQCP